MPSLISSGGLVKLKEHKYIYHNRSKLEEVINKHIWERAISLVPMNIAPNTITLFGFICMAMSYIPMMFYDMTLTKEIPSWLFLSAAILQFIYQTADGIDGKQARRTGSSSPLGHLFDHGCDSFSLSFLLLCIIQAMRLGDDHVTIFLFFTAGLSIFWIFMWNQSHTQVLLQHIAQIGVTEAQVLMMAVLAVTGIFGQSVWMKPTADLIPSLLTNLLPTNPVVQAVLHTPIKLTFIYVLLSLVMLMNIITVAKTNSACRSKLDILKDHIPFIHLVIIFVIWMQTQFYQNHRALTLLVFGMYFSLIIARIIIHGVTEEPFPIYHRELMVMTVLTPILLVKDMLFPHVKLPFSEEKAFLIFVLLLTLISCYVWISKVMIEISQHLGIRCFSIKPVEKSQPKHFQPEQSQPNPPAGMSECDVKKRQ